MSDGLDADLTAYYEAEAAAGARTEHGSLRRSLLADFVAVMTAEHRHAVVDVGAGPGLDVAGFGDAGLHPVGIDLAPGNVRRMRERGLHGLVGSIFALPLATGEAEAVWTMSTLVHVPDARLEVALGELVRVVRPGGPIGIGTWGGRDWEGTSDVTRFDPARFFALRSHDRWGDVLARWGRVERFDTWTTDQPGWEYQFAVIRP